MRFTLYEGTTLLLEDATVIELLTFLIANRISGLPVTEAREQLELLTLIQDNAPTPLEDK